MKNYIAILTHRPRNYFGNTEDVFKIYGPVEGLENIKAKAVEAAKYSQCDKEQIEYIRLYMPIDQLKKYESRFLKQAEKQSLLAENETFRMAHEDKKKLTVKPLTYFAAKKVSESEIKLDKEKVPEEVIDMVTEMDKKLKKKQKK